MLRLFVTWILRHPAHT